MKTYIVSRERKNEIKDIVIKIFKKAELEALPIDLGAIVRAYGIECIRADAAMLRGAAESAPEGMAVRSGEKYYLLYEPSYARTRVRYTVACQLAHIFLSHLTGECEKEAAELEARYFADELLMPLAVLDSFGCRDAEAIAEKCGVSLAAAQIRVRDFERRDKYKKQNGETEYDMKFLGIFFGGRDESAKGAEAGKA